MSRSRNIKPGFFKNDLLVALPFEVRLLFIGLWTEADRAGRLEDRPLKIRMSVFPADNVDVEAGLQALHGAGFIHRYQAGEIKCIQILAWDKHQNPHCKEAASTLPTPCKHGASTVPVSEIPERAGLIPDSLNLIPDSLDKSAASRQEPENSPSPSAAGLACLLMRQAGCLQTNPSHLGLLAALSEGVTPQALADTAAEAIANGVQKPFAYAITTARGRQAEGARPVITGPPRIVPAAPLGKTAQAINALEEMKRGLAQNRTADRLPEIALLGSGTHPSG